MHSRRVTDAVTWMGAVDFDRRLFDALIPLPDGTSYNAYLVRGSEKTVLLDTVDPAMAHLLMSQLAEVPRLDYVVAHHAEQDHAGVLPQVMERFPEAVLLCTAKAREFLIDHLHLDPARIRPVADNETLDLGGKTLRFLHTPWVHWPETMCTWLEEDRCLFSCDFFGSHLATTDLAAGDRCLWEEAAKRYFAEIMMPFRTAIRANMAKVGALPVGRILPSHGPIHEEPETVMALYREWCSEDPKNEAVVAYVSMHGSTQLMIDRLVAGLVARGVTVRQFNLSDYDLGKLAMSLVDAATIIVGTPTVHVGPHPRALYAATVAAALRPRLKQAAVVGSYGWGTKAVETLVGIVAPLKVEVRDPVYVKGLPREADYEALDKLAEAIAAKHRALGLLA